MGFRDRRFGVELEFETPKFNNVGGFNVPFRDEDVAFSLVAWQLHQENGINFKKSYKNGGWNFGFEGLDHYSTCAAELTTPIMRGVKDMRLLKGVCQTLTDMGCVTTKETGLHVHVDVQDLTPYQLAAVLARYAKFEKEIDNILDESRWDNDYCMPIQDILPKMTWEALQLRQTKGNSKMWAFKLHDRYYKVNALSVHERGTLEFRHHHGTLDPERVEAWVKFCINFIDQTLKELKGFRVNKKNIPKPSSPKPIFFFQQDSWYPQDISYAFPKWRSRSPFAGLQPNARHILTA